MDFRFWFAPDFSKMAGFWRFWQLEGRQTMTFESLHKVSVWLYIFFMLIFVLFFYWLVKVFWFLAESPGFKPHYSMFKCQITFSTYLTRNCWRKNIATLKHSSEVMGVKRRYEVSIPHWARVGTIIAVVIFYYGKSVFTIFSYLSCHRRLNWPNKAKIDVY